MDLRCFSVLLVLFSILILGPSGHQAMDRKPSPIVFIPGKAGNQMEAKVDKLLSYYNHCPLQRDWHRIWMDVWALFPDKIECWAENMQLHFNATAQRSDNVPGVRMRVPGWGSTEAVEYLDPSWAAWFFGDVGRYMKPLFEELKDWGYVKGVNLRSAPYDFRLAPNSQTRYFEDLQQLIEETYEINDQKPVVLMTHSMGGLNARYFLSRRTTEWKNKYIRAFVPVNTPWKGTVKLAHSLTSGINWGVESIDPIVVRGMQRTMETALLLLPRQGGWEDDDVIVSTAQRNYTVTDYEDLFEDMTWHKGTPLLDYVWEEDTSDHPGVETFCFYGSGSPTAEKLIWPEGASFPDDQPEVEWGSGDGTVNLKSLQYCRHWLDDPLHGKITHVKHVHDTNHLNTCFSDTFLKWYTTFAFDTFETEPLFDTFETEPLFEKNEDHTMTFLLETENEQGGY